MQKALSTLASELSTEDLIYQDAAMCAARWHNVLFVAYTNGLVETHIDVLETSIETLAPRCPGRVLAVCMRVGTVSAPSAAVMRRLQRAVHRSQRHVLRSHFIFDQECVETSIVRALLRSVRVITGWRGSFRFHVGIRAASAALVHELRDDLGMDAKASELHGILTALRDHLRGE